MRNFRSLRMLDLFQGLFRSFNIDYGTMRKILELKLTMDERRVPTIFSQMKTKEGNQFLKSLGIYAVYGLMTIPFLFFGDNMMLQMSIFFGIAMFILMTSLIADFSTVLLDIRDKMILNTKPISDRTINAAKVVHIGIYLTLLTIAFLGVPSIVVLAVKGIVFFLIYLVLLIFLLLFIIAMTALVYMLILQFFDGERLKDMINYVQIALSIGVFVGYQVLVRSFDFVDLVVAYDFRWWHLFIPPLWFGAPFQMLLGNSHSGALIILSIMAVVIPVLAITIYSRLMPAFERNLQKLLSEARGTRRKRRIWVQWWTYIVCRNREEKVFFRFAWQMMLQERAFKLKVYPSIGIGFVAPFIVGYTYLEEGGLEALRQSNAYLFIYFSLLIVGSVVMLLPYSSKYKGAWIFRVTPAQNEADLHRASLKASLVQLFLPVYCIQSVIFIGIFGWRIVPDLITVFIVGLMYACISYRLGSGGTMPFSDSIDHAFDSGTGKQALYMLIVAGFAIIHIFMKKVQYGTFIYLFVLLVGFIITWKMVFRNIRSRYV